MSLEGTSVPKFSIKSRKLIIPYVKLISVVATYHKKHYLPGGHSVPPGPYWVPKDPVGTLCALRIVENNGRERNCGQKGIHVMSKVT